MSQQVKAWEGWELRPGWIPRAAVAAGSRLARGLFLAVAAGTCGATLLWMRCADPATRCRRCAAALPACRRRRRGGCRGGGVLGAHRRHGVVAPRGVGVRAGAMWGVQGGGGRAGVSGRCRVGGGGRACCAQPGAPSCSRAPVLPDPTPVKAPHPAHCVRHTPRAAQAMSFLGYLRATSRTRRSAAARFNAALKDLQARWGGCGGWGWWGGRWGGRAGIASRPPTCGCDAEARGRGRTRRMLCSHPGALTAPQACVAITFPTPDRCRCRCFSCV